MRGIDRHCQRATILYLASLTLGLVFCFGLGDIAAAPVAVAGEPYQQGVDAYRAHDYKKAMVYFKLAAAGSTKAMCDIGILYEGGLGVARDFHKAMHWYRKAAAAGDAAATYGVGALYLGGPGVPRDYRKAMRWFKKAAALHEPQAMGDIGYLYRNGWGVPKDYHRAMVWFRRAAALGDAVAMTNVGLLYERGLGVPQSERKAVAWFTKAVAAGNAEAKAELIRIGSRWKPLHSGFYEIRNGFFGKPCVVGFLTQRRNHVLQGVNVSIASAVGVTTLSEIPGNRKKGVSPTVMLLITPGTSKPMPTIGVNGGWQLGGSLGTHSFEYNFHVYHYDKKKDIWIPVGKHLPKVK